MQKIHSEEHLDRRIQVYVSNQQLSAKVDGKRISEALLGKANHDDLELMIEKVKSLINSGMV